MIQDGFLFLGMSRMFKVTQIHGVIYMNNLLTGVPPNTNTIAQEQNTTCSDGLLMSYSMSFRSRKKKSSISSMQTKLVLVVF